MTTITSIADAPQCTRCGVKIYLHQLNHQLMATPDTQFQFDVQLNWLSAKKGVLFSHDAEGTIHVATAPKFGGEGKPWTAEHLLLGSISTCFMSTFLNMAQKSGFHIAHFDCNTIGQIEMTEGAYRFTRIDIYPRVFLNSESARTKAVQAMEKTHRCCIVSNSLNAGMYYHSEILIAPAADTEPADTGNEYDRANLLL